MDNVKALARIRRNIERHGYHAYVVSGGQVPRYAYTIGLCAKFGTELILAGAAYYLGDGVRGILRAASEALGARRELGSPVLLDGLGVFSLRAVHDSWSSVLMLGALDYYDAIRVPVVQIVPVGSQFTVDVPDMSREAGPRGEPVWQWVSEPWLYDVPETSTVVTNLDALRGARITEVARWEAAEWEMFAGPGPDVTEDEARLVPLGCLIATDPTLLTAMQLDQGKGMWRSAEGGEWNVWGR